MRIKKPFGTGDIIIGKSSKPKYYNKLFRVAYILRFSGGYELIGLHDGNTILLDKITVNRHFELDNNGNILYGD